MDLRSTNSWREPEQSDALMQSPTSHLRGRSPGSEAPSTDVSEKKALTPVVVVGSSKLVKWPNGPRNLREVRGSQWLSTSVEILVTCLPLLFLVIGAIALNLDGKPASSLGQNVIEASKYGTTAFPIVFAAVVGRMNRAVALKWSESGARLGALEQLFGSQSLAMTIERFFDIRKYDVLGVTLIIVWFLSPFGSQMTLRLLEPKRCEQRGEARVTYLNTTTDVYPVFWSASAWLNNTLPVSSLAKLGEPL